MSLITGLISYPAEFTYSGSIKRSVIPRNSLKAALLSEWTTLTVDGERNPRVKVRNVNSAVVKKA